MGNEDIRWQQRLQNFGLALTQLRAAVELFRSRPLSDLESQGMIQAFEFTHELAWKVLKDYFEYQGNPSITGSRDATREAFERGLLQNAEVWMEMIKSRNRTSHTYNKKVAAEIVQQITQSYFEAFTGLEKTLLSLAEKST